MKPIQAFAALLLSAAIPGSLTAQLEGPYRLAAGDTLRFDESTESTVVISTPQGDITAQSTHDARIAIALSDDGGIHGWYEDLELGSSGPNGMMTPSTASVVGAPYRLSITPTGSVSTLFAPTPSDEIQAITDLAQQFLDFLVIVPSSRPSAGETWADTLVSDESGLPETTQEHRAIRSYTVAGDTIYDGRSAIVIHTVTSVSIESTSPMEGQPMTVTTTLRGGERGVAIFDWDAGRLLSRERHGELDGIFRIDGGPQPIEFPQSMTYAGRMTG